MSYVCPHKPANSRTITQYVKLFLGMGRIDITVFTAHSARSASTSTVNSMDCLVLTLKKQQGEAGIVPFASIITYQY